MTFSKKKKNLVLRHSLKTYIGLEHTWIALSQPLECWCYGPLLPSTSTFK